MPRWVSLKHDGTDGTDGPAYTDGTASLVADGTDYEDGTAMYTAIGGTDVTAYPDPTTVHGADGTAFIQTGQLCRCVTVSRGSCYLTPSTPATPARHIKGAYTHWGVVQHRSVSVQILLL